MKKDAPKGVRWDAASFERVGRILERAKAKGESTDRFTATIEGVGYSSPPASSSKKSTEPLVRPLEGAYDAVVVIGTIRDVRIIGK